MPLHSYVQNYLHIIWGTHDHFPIIKGNLKTEMFRHLDENLQLMSVNKYGLNLQPEHIHLLISLPSDIALAKFVKDMKGESSHWINQNDFLKVKFHWQRGYGAFSVSASQLDKVKNYIKNQDKHHAKRPFIEEYKEWVKKYGLHYEDN